MPLQPLRLMIMTGYDTLLALLTAQFIANSGIAVTIQATNYNLRVEWMAAFAKGKNNMGNSTGPDFDALMFTSEMMGDLASTGALMDLQPFIKGDAKQVVGIPILESLFIMYVNWPLLTSAYNISRPTLTQPGRLSFYPDTWQELISVMQQVNATASDPATGLPRHALCLPFKLRITFLLQAVMASIMQTQGFTQGFLYDPLTLEPLTNNTAMQQLTMSPLPASTEVLDRSTMQLVPCTQELCNSQRATQ
ncbi:predicted protein [Haematococcus lacustris]|uniref:Uncharacterized protein n=1 Tax=Haematococcus lacustris TaxID=44745 RepID=A0A6A0A247_HAELA|nr:predicted protein [Haematococcus lacustris]